MEATRRGAATARWGCGTLQAPCGNGSVAALKQHATVRSRYGRVTTRCCHDAATVGRGTEATRRGTATVRQEYGAIGARCGNGSVAAWKQQGTLRSRDGRATAP